MPRTYQDILASRIAGLPENTDSFRVIDGEADGYPKLFIDRFGDRTLISTRDRDIPHQLLQQIVSEAGPVYHKRLDQDDKQPPVPIAHAGDSTPLQFHIVEQGVRFLIDMGAGYSQGIFLDQRDNRRRVRQACRPGMRILNTFAYTGAFSVYAALGGAITTTLDLAQPCLDWARQNFLLNALEPDEHYFCKGDALHWLDRFAKQQRTFHGIILDPPTFSRDKNGKVFRVERHYGDLVSKAIACLEPGGWLLCSTNCRKLSHRDFRIMVASAAPGADLRHDPMPFDFPGEDYLKCLFVQF
ncbi:class I SAM-dependent methyltransferase [Akkermansia sp. N21116]|uniref:class I SAM-dependent rRNA methyltransferase n=1 Tax=Akkermansia sp. N21116 TaxID=3040764 RepID=UPI00244ED1AD|nr:class I SAM-dependent methyltransferase [Akkermansia sp. N21116]WPX41107.1 class I SAM-dependent methyltransferase [Akkermansia sp. N21116]